MKNCKRLIATLILALMMVIAPATAMQADAANAYVTAINAVRAQNGVAPMKENTALERAAVTRATEASSVWSHTRPDGTPFYTVNASLCYGENLARYIDSPAEVVAAWMASPSHRENLLDPGFTMVGVGTTVINGVSYTTAEFF